MRHLLLALPILIAQAPPAQAQVLVSGAVQLPGVNIGINIPAYPDLMPVPGYPVYYAPQVNANLFFYEGQYWVLQGNNWYESGWYNGPWRPVAPIDVPAFVLRVPVRYYRAPPPYFRDWRADAAPHWGQHWGTQWQRRRGDWNRWDRQHAPAAVAPPTYQRDYAADRYPATVQQQREIQSRHEFQQARERPQPQQRRDADRGPERGGERQRERGQDQDRR